MPDTDPYAVFRQPADPYAVFRRHPASGGVDPTEDPEEERRKKLRKRLEPIPGGLPTEDIHVEPAGGGKGAAYRQLSENVLSGMKGGADFLAHLPEDAMNLVLEASPSPARTLHVKEGSTLPAAVEGTFQSVREERERLKEEAAANAVNQPPWVAAMGFALPQTAGNLADPTMLLAPGEVGRLAGAAERVLPRAGGAAARRVLPGVIEEAGVRAFEEGSPAEAAFLRRRAADLEANPVGLSVPAEHRQAMRAGGEGFATGGPHRTWGDAATAVGMRATPEEGAELARVSLPIGEPEIGALRGAEGPVEAGAKTTGTKHAVTRAELEAQGLPAVEGRPQSPTWEDAKRIFTEDPEAPRRLAQEVAARPRPLSDVENDLLLHDRQKLRTDYRGALDAEDAALQSGDPAAAAEAKLRRVSLETAYRTNSEAVDLAGTEWGRAGTARQKLIAEDYSPLHLQQRYRVANLGEEAPEPVRRKLVEISAKLEEAQARAAAAEERAQELEALRLIRSEQAGAAKAARSGKRLATRVELDAENDALTAEFARRASTPRAGLDPELAAILAKKARNRVRAGVNNLTDLVDTLYNEAAPHVPGLEPRDVRDAIAGASPAAQKVARSQAVSEYASLRREARVLNALDDAQAKLAASPAPAQRRLLENEVTRWQAEVEKISAGTAAPGAGPLSDPQRLAASKTRVARRIAELQEQIASGEFISKTRAPVTADAELLNARGQAEALRRQADKIIQQRELQNRGALEKGMDWTAGWGRFIKLTGTATLQKISAAAGERALIFKPLEEVIGAGLSKLPVLRTVAARAPIEGGGSIDAIAKSYAGFFGQQARAESAAYLKGGEGPLELALGKPYHEAGVPAWMEYPGKVHAALKAPAKVAGYEFAMEKQARWYLMRGQGEELLNPLVQEEMKARAWEYAQRDIFMGDNAFVSGFRKMLQDVPGQTRVTKAGKTAGKVLFPIVKVPTNYALELTDYALGAPKGAVRLIVGAVEHGLAELPAAEAELIMRQLKKGSLGAGLIALGATGIVEAGGYYHPGEHRRENDLQPGEVRIAGIKLPHQLLHHPAVEALQIGATLHRQREFADGLADSVWGAAEQVPFFEEPISAARTLRDDPTQYLGQIERGMTIPPDVQRLARITDQRKPPTVPEGIGQQLGLGGLEAGPVKVPEIKARKRKARGGFWEQLREEEMLGIPGLRKKVR